MTDHQTKVNALWNLLFGDKTPHLSIDSGVFWSLMA